MSGHGFDAYADSTAAFDDALAWADLNGYPTAVPDRELLARYLSTPTAADRYQRWCDDLVADHLDKQRQEREDR